MSESRCEKPGTKIIATVGPASNSSEQIHALIHEGVDVFRLNFSHGTHEEHQQVIDRIDNLNKIHDSSVGILADLQGPKIRVGMVENDSLIMEEGAVIYLYGVKGISKGNKIFVHYELLTNDVRKGERIMIDDGKIVLDILEVQEGKFVKAIIKFGGVLKPGKGVNFPDTNLSMPALTEKDLADLDFILTQPVNWIALSFVRDDKSVKALRKIIKSRNHQAKVIAKIEKPEAVKNIKRIVKAADGVMVARGDLGVEIPMEELPGVQRNIISLCIKRSKVVIVATQMMESMITNASPTRAEITDVANAVIEGTDAVMLSGETAIGMHPELVVQSMKRIIRSAEKTQQPMPNRPIPEAKSESFLNDVVCFNAAKLADELKANAIIGVTVSGYTAFKVSSFRPLTKMYIFSGERFVLSTLNLVRGVKGFYYEKQNTLEETHEDLVEILIAKDMIKKGDIVVHTGSMPLKDKGRTNMIKVSRV